MMSHAWWYTCLCRKSFPKRAENISKSLWIVWLILRNFCHECNTFRSFCSQPCLCVVTFHLFFFVVFLLPHCVSVVLFPIILQEGGWEHQHVSPRFLFIRCIYRRVYFTCILEVCWSANDKKSFLLLRLLSFLETATNMS